MQPLLAPEAGNAVELLQQQLRALQKHIVSSLQPAQHLLHGLGARRAAFLAACNQGWKDDGGRRRASNQCKHSSCKLLAKCLRSSVQGVYAKMYSFTQCKIRSQSFIRSAAAAL